MICHHRPCIDRCTSLLGKIFHDKVKRFNLKKVPIAYARGVSHLKKVHKTSKIAVVHRATRIGYDYFSKYQQFKTLQEAYFTISKRDPRQLYRLKLRNFAFGTSETIQKSWNLPPQDFGKVHDLADAIKWDFSSMEIVVIGRGLVSSDKILPDDNNSIIDDLHRFERELKEHTADILELCEEIKNKKGLPKKEKRKVFKSLIS